jgi:hypothetical protein
MASNRAPGVIRRGTASDLANLGVGYSASGASEHTRHAAHSTNTKLANYEEPKAPVWTRTALEQLGEKIAKQAKFLAAFHVRLRTERDPERRAKIMKDIPIKARYLEKLKQEQREALRQ